MNICTFFNLLNVFYSNHGVLGTFECLDSLSCLFFIHYLCLLVFQQSRDQGLDVEPSIVGGPQSMYSSLSTLSRSQYPTSNGMWTPQYPTLARSPSASGQSDSVFLDGPPEEHALPPSSPGRYCKDPTYPNGSQDNLETDGPNGFHPHHFHHSLPRRSHGYNHNHASPGEKEISSSLCFLKQIELYNIKIGLMFLSSSRVYQPGSPRSQARDP